MFIDEPTSNVDKNSNNMPKGQYCELGQFDNDIWINQIFERLLIDDALAYKYVNLFIDTIFSYIYRDQNVS